MPAPLARFSLLILATLSVLEMRANPANDAVAAVLKLRSLPGYSWDVATTKPGITSPVPPRTKHGGMTARGEMILKQIWADGRVVNLVVEPAGDTIVQTDEGWNTKSELERLSRTAKWGSVKSSWLRLALTSFDGMSPEEELSHVLNDATSYQQTGDDIAAILPVRGASYWLGSGRQIPDASGTLHLRLRDGLIREFRIAAEGEISTGAAGDEKERVEFESTTTFNYASAPSLPPEAKQKLDEASAPSRKQ